MVIVPRLNALYSCQVRNLLKSLGSWYVNIINLFHQVSRSNCDGNSFIAFLKVYQLPNYNYKASFVVVVWGCGKKVNI